MSAAAALSRIQAAGGEALVIDGRLKLRAARPLPDALVAEVRAHKPELLALLAANDTAPDPEPTTFCPTCGCGLYWRVSAIEPGGPGPWQCARLRRCAARRVAGWLLHPAARSAPTGALHAEAPAAPHSGCAGRGASQDHIAHSVRSLP